MATYSSPNWNNSGAWNKPFYKNPYTYSYEPSQDWVNAIVDGLRRQNQPQEPDIPEERSFLDRTIDVLMTPTYVGANMVNNAIDGDDSTSIWQGFKDGMKAGWAFGDGHEQGETTYSDVLETAGWKPEGTLGKIAKGTVGFGLDVLLDPTTYLTGGLSAVVKGTGRVGKSAQTLGKLGDDVARATRYNTRIDDLVAKGVNPDLAKRVADKGFDKAIDQPLTNITHMTEEMASQIIKSQTVKRGVVKSEEELATSARQLADEYNRILGIRDAKGAGDVTFGIGNLPFAPKKWEKFNVRLGSQKPLQEMSDAIGLSTAYAGLRNFVYGSQIGKMFSTTSPMYKLANDNPAKLWEALEYVEHTRGLKMDKLQEEKLIRERFKNMGLTEAENKEVLELLQDKTVWHKIAEKAKLTDLAKFNEARSTITKGAEATRQQVDELMQKREIAKVWQKALDDEIVSEKEFLDMMKQEFRDDFSKLKVGQINDVKQMEQVMKALEDEIAELGKPTGDVGALHKLYESSKLEREAMEKHMSQRVETPDTKDLKVKQESKESVAMEGVIKKGDTAPGRENTYALKEALSSYILGHNKGFTTITDDAIDTLMKQIDEGKSLDEIREFVEKNENLFSPHMQEVNRYVARKLGYKAWNEDGMKHPLMKLAGIDVKKAEDYTIPQLNALVTSKLQAGELTEQQTKKFMELLHLDYQRKIMRRQYGEMSTKEFMHFQSKERDAELLRELGNFEEGQLDLRRVKFVDDDSASATRRASEKDPYELPRHLTSGETSDVVDDIINSGIFTADAVMNASSTFTRYLSRIVDEADNIAVNQFQKSYMDMSQSQKKLVLKIATENIAKGKAGKGVDPTLAKKAMQEAQKRAQKEAEELRKNQPELANMSPEEILARTNIAQADMGRKEQLIKELESVKDEYQSFTGKAKQDRDSMKEFYKQRVAEQEGVILRLEEKHQEFGHWLKEASDENIERLTQQVKQYEEIIATDDALETWMRSHSEADLALIKDPQRYTRNVTEDPNLPDGWFASAGEDGIRVRPGEIDKRAFFSALKGWVKELSDEGYDWDKIKSIVHNPEKMRQFIMEHELSHVKNQDWKTKPNRGGYEDPATRKIETRASVDALEMIKNFDIDAMLRDATPVDAGKIWLDNKASSKKVADTVRMLRDEFDRIGMEEVQIGKLSMEQFRGLLDQYVPHILSPDGEAHFAKLHELTEHGSKVTHDMGYGVVYNPHAQSRSIKGKTIEQINEFFRERLQGKNLFSENVADIYLTRAMKHTELMYDDKYMHTMMNVFGKDIPESGVIEAGYKAVMNHGMLKKTTSDIASMNLSVHISDDVSTYLSDNFMQLQDMARMSGMDVDKFISAHIDEYLKANYPEEKMSKMFESFHKQAIKDTRLSDDILGRDGVPMVEMDARQIEGIRNAWNDAYDRQLMSLNNSMSKAMKRGDMTRVAEVQKRLEKFGTRTPPQIKQVNDVIVQKANQARQLQRAKDESKFLQMYDKFLHFMKLNQTVVTPAFHARNKMSNAYLNWLGVGRDAVDKDLQIATVMLARTKGDIDSVKEIVDGRKFGHKQLSKPLNIVEPHPSLVEAIGLNNGQLHWTDLYELALRYDVIDTGQFAADIGAGASTKGLFKNLRQTRKDGTTRNLDPTDTENFVLYKKGTQVGTVVENGDRLLHFASMLKQGKSIDEAVRSSKQFLFDYSDLTAFEQSTMKRIFPYYTWLRKNARLQVGQLIEQPEKFRQVAKVMTGIEHMTPEEERMNNSLVGNWAQGWVQMPWDVQTTPAREGAQGQFIPAKQEKVLFNPAMPFMDLNRIPDPTQPLDSIKELFTQSSPQIKVPIEQLTNKNVFLDSEIVGENDNSILARANHLASQFGLYNYGSGFVTKDNGNDLAMHTLATLTGMKANSVDYETSKYMFMDKMSEEEEQGSTIMEAIRRRLRGE